MKNEITKEEKIIIRKSKLENLKGFTLLQFINCGIFVSFFSLFTGSIKSNGMTKARFAEIMGVRGAYITDIETGYRKMSMKKLVFIADILKLNQKQKLALYEKEGV